MTLIDYETSAYEPRGRDLAAIMMCNMFSVEDGALCQVADYPNEIWRQNFIGHYLDEFKCLAPNEFVDDQDTVDHVMMECDLNVLHCIHFLMAFILKQDRRSYIVQLDRKFAQSWIEARLLMERMYWHHKSYFVDKYKCYVTS